MDHQSYFITGASGGVGLEATRMLALHLSEGSDDGNTTTAIYLLCRSEEKAMDAIQDIRNSLDNETNEANSQKVILEFLKFDAYDDENTIRKNIEVAFREKSNPPTLGGILLNAGGFGERKPNQGRQTNEEHSPEACGIAKLNLIGHVFLVKNLLDLCQKDPSSPPRIVPVSSEAAFCTPGMDYHKADFLAHLLGDVPTQAKMMGTDYGWTKGILALYWAAYARHHLDTYVTVVSPGAMSSTKLLDQGSVSLPLKAIARLSQCFGGNHTVHDGAERYVWALLGKGPFASDASFTSGSFWASTRGFCKDFGDVVTLPKGKFVSDQNLQDKAWAAVQTIVGEGIKS